MRQRRGETRRDEPPRKLLASRHWTVTDNPSQNRLVGDGSCAGFRRACRNVVHSTRTEWRSLASMWGCGPSSGAKVRIRDAVDRPSRTCVSVSGVSQVCHDTPDGTGLAGLTILQARGSLKPVTAIIWPAGCSSSNPTCRSHASAIITFTLEPPPAGSAWLACTMQSTGSSTAARQSTTRPSASWVMLLSTWWPGSPTGMRPRRRCTRATERGSGRHLPTVRGASRRSVPS